jgi:hypothetical protein
LIASTPLAVFKVRRNGRVVLEMDGTRFPLGEISSKVRDITEFTLAEFAKELKMPGDRLRSLSAAVRRLSEGMAYCAFLLVGDRTDLLIEIMDRFRRAWPVWHQATDIVPLVEIHDREANFVFPFELLPVFDDAPIEEFDNYVAADKALRRFLGFGTVVRRTSGEKAELENLLANPHLRMQLFTYDMPGARAEIKNLESFDQLYVEGPWPCAGLDSAQVTERLIDVLYDPRRTLGGGTCNGDPVQIQHFACRSRTDNCMDAGYTLVLGDSTHERKVTLGSIRIGFLRRAHTLGLFAGPRPLVIANACASAKIDKDTLASFQKWFIRNHHRGFVGTEINIGDLPAAEFARRFYEELLEGKPLGEAVVRARGRLLAEYGSPLGLLYVLYGEPGLKIVNDPGGGALGEGIREVPRP